MLYQLPPTCEEPMERMMTATRHQTLKSMVGQMLR
jgi:hypothetical protein